MNKKNKLAFALFRKYAHEEASDMDFPYLVM